DQAFKAAEAIAAMAPGDLNKVLFCNSGSEAADTSLKVALAYHRARGEGHRNVFIGRERGYHGVGFGGMSVGGIPANRKAYGTALLPRVDHMRFIHDPANAYIHNQEPESKEDFLLELENRILPLHDPSNVAAVIVEPVAGSAGWYIPPKGYLKRLREICDKHGILLIFDEVITGFGRVGKAFAAQRFGVTPDMITTAKGLTNGAVPMGAVFASGRIHDAFMHGPEGAIELFHGYTYSGHPLACAAALATLDTYQEENLFEKAIELGGYWEDAIHALKGLPNVVDIRNYGLIGAVELAAREGAPGSRGYDAFQRAFHEQNLMVRCTGDVLALSPPLILQKEHIDRIFDRLAATIRATA
ncbi:aminotransferase class III-fold pyridoxal phosphate-dependent enzyme, partial [Arenimonas sp.]|uniref:aminotransferase class III-fold pyridoxal phosphate-dependent enzyme n=1 Tax=Arenimonas sp. TaxID=1872635 RepID=UPI002E3668AA